MPMSGQGPTQLPDPLSAAVAVRDTASVSSASVLVP